MKDMIWKYMTDRVLENSMLFPQESVNIYVHRALNRFQTQSTLAKFLLRRNLPN